MQRSEHGLSCTPQEITSVFDPDDLSWKASDVVHAIEAARKAPSLRVPFYMYDKDIPGGTDIAQEITKLDKCVRKGLPPGELAQYSGEYWFIKALIDHPWRVRRPADAMLLVMPLFFAFENRIKNSPRWMTHHTKTLRAINRTGLLHARPNDHVYVALDWRAGSAFTSNLGVAGGRIPATTRALTEYITAHPNMHGRVVPRSSGQSTGREDFKIVAPYVDNSYMSGDSDLLVADSNKHGGTVRNITFFFGGMTAQNLMGAGIPGRARQGYYLRHSLMQTWSRADPGSDAFNGTILVSSDDKWLKWLAVLHCEVANGSYKDKKGNLPFENGRKPHNTSYGLRAGTRCIKRCTDDLLQRGTTGTCHGRYKARELLSRTQFALCLRGDVPTSPRPYDAIRFGAIPVVIADNVWALGMPFQCLVPWELMTLSISEAQFVADPPAALRNLTNRLTSTQRFRMQRLIHHFARDVLYFFADGVRTSRVAENLLIEAASWRTRTQPVGCCPLRDRSRWAYESSPIPNRGVNAATFER